RTAGSDDKGSDDEGPVIGACETRTSSVGPPIPRRVLNIRVESARMRSGSCAFDDLGLGVQDLDMAGDSGLAAGDSGLAVGREIVLGVGACSSAAGRGDPAAHVEG